MEGLTRVCLLTGASGLLGTAFIERCAGRYQIAAVHNSRPIGFATQSQSFVDPLDPARDIPLNNEAVYAVPADLSRESEVDRVVDEVLQRFGHVDVLINAAGRRDWAHLLAAGALARAQAVFDVNVLAPLRLAVGIADRCWRSNEPANVEANRNVINVSSVAGLYVYPDYGQSLYAASKAALNHLTYHLASELWDIGVRVNAVAPDTFPGRVPLEDVLEAILELDRSDETGQVRELSRVVA